jgi:hypothetical protein
MTLPLLHRQKDKRQVRSMKVKELKALRKSQHEVMQPLRRQLDDDAWQRLNDYITSVVELVKDTNNTREERLLVENENLKRQLAEQEKQRREELIRIRQTCADELAAEVSGIEAKYQKKTTQLEDTIAKLERIGELKHQGVLRINEIACTSKAFQAAKSRFGDGAVARLICLATDVIVLRIDKGKDGRWSIAEFDVVPYQTDKGWNVFVCGSGQLSTMPTLQTVSDFAIKRALS